MNIKKASNGIVYNIFKSSQLQKTLIKDIKKTKMYLIIFFNLFTSKRKYHLIGKYFVKKRKKIVIINYLNELINKISK